MRGESSLDASHWQVFVSEKSNSPLIAARLQHPPRQLFVSERAKLAFSIKTFPLAEWYSPGSIQQGQFSPSVCLSILPGLSEEAGQPVCLLPRP
jgi:hypothetical protein